MSEQTVADQFLSTIGNGLYNAFIAVTGKNTELGIATALTEMVTDANTMYFSLKRK